MSDLPAKLEAVEHLRDLLARHGHALDVRTATTLLRMSREQLWAVEQLLACALAGTLSRAE